MKRQPKGSSDGGQFAPDTRGKNPPVSEPLRMVTMNSSESDPTVDGVFDVFKGLSSEYADMSLPVVPEAGEPKKVLFVRGIPGSGKSTWVHGVVAAFPQGTVARLSNDDVSQMVFGDPFPQGVEGMQDFLNEVRQSLLNAALRNPSVRMVIVDNTNLAPKTVGMVEKWALMAGADTEVDDRFLKVPLEECLRRNANRDRKVPESVIKKMWEQGQRLRPRPARTAQQLTPYPNDDMSLPETVIVDMDGTLARATSGRNPYDWSRVGEDEPNPAVVATVKDMLAQGREVTVISARDKVCQAETETWLRTHVGEGIRVILRDTNDMRPGFQVKPDLFAQHIAGKRRVTAVLDDEDGVVKAWRALGLPTWQVNDGPSGMRNRS